MKRWSRRRQADARRIVLGVEPLDDRSAPAVLAPGLDSLISALVEGSVEATARTVTLLTATATPIEEVELAAVSTSVTGTTDDLASVEVAVLGPEAEVSATLASANSAPVVAIVTAPISTDATSVEAPVLGVTVDPVVAPGTTPDLPRVEIGTEPIVNSVVVTPIVLPGGVAEREADDLPAPPPAVASPAVVTPPASDAPAPSTTSEPVATGEAVTASGSFGADLSSVSTPTESGVPSSPTGFASGLTTVALPVPGSADGFAAVTGTTDVPAAPAVAVDTLFAGAADLIRNAFGDSVLVAAEAVQADGPADRAAAPTPTQTATAVVKAGETVAPEPAGPATPLGGFMPFNLDGLLAEIDGLLADVGAPAPWSGEALKVSKWWAYGLAAAAGLYVTRRWNGLSTLVARLTRKRPAGEVA